MKKKIYLSSLFLAFVLCISQLHAQVLPCPAPTGLISTSITSSTATISWLGAANTGTFNYRYRLANTVNWTSGSTALLNANLSGLTAASLYEWQVRLGCPNSAGAITYSAWSASSFFTTLSITSCGTPGGLFTNTITTTSALLHWTATGASNYKIRYRQSGSLAWIIKNSTGNSKSLTGLNPSSGYEWQVKGKCISPNGAITWSSWSGVSTFQTSGTSNCATPSGLASTFVAGSNSVLLAWGATGAISYNIRYRSLNTATWNTTTSATNSKSIAGLAGGTGFEWQVQSVCGINGAIVLSAWSASAYFTTLAPLSPNPARDRISFKHFSYSAQNIQLFVRDLYGSTFISEKRQAVDGDNQFELNVNELKNGMYYLELNSSEGTQVLKFYVQH